MSQQLVHFTAMCKQNSYYHHSVHTKKCYLNV